MKIEKSALILGRKCLDCVHPWVKCFFQNVMLIISKRKNSKMFLCGAFFLVFSTKCLSKCPNPTKPILPWKIPCWGPALRHYPFLKNDENLKWLTVSQIRLCLDNCSVTCTATSCYVLHHTYSEFWHIQNSVYSDIMRYIQAYSALLRYIHAYWGILRHYSDILSTLCNPHILPYSQLWH